MFIKRVGNLHPTDERSDNHVVIVVIHQNYLALEITDILFEAFPRLHLDGEEVVILL